MTPPGYPNVSTALFLTSLLPGSTLPVCDPAPAAPLRSTPAAGQVYAAVVVLPNAPSDGRSHSSETQPLHLHRVTQPECTIYLSWRLFPWDPRQALLWLDEMFSLPRNNFAGYLVFSFLHARCELEVTEAQDSYT